MENLREGTPRPATPAPAGGIVTEATADAARVAEGATAAARAVPRAPATVTVTVKTTTAQATEIVATPDTTVGEIVTRACGDLGVRDAARYLLVAGGEVMGEPERTLRDVLGERAETELTTRLVRRPEAGGAPCPS